MAATTLLSLPTEILDKIYSYLAWDRSKSLRPYRPDVVSVSLTCRHLRVTILPIIFQDVILKLRWVDGALVEPALFKIRKDYPHLANYVRSVYIETHFRRPLDPHGKLKEFTGPDELSDWVLPSSRCEDRGRDMEVSHRQRVKWLTRTVMAVQHDFEIASPCPPYLSDYRIKVGRKILGQDDVIIDNTMQNHYLSSSSSTLEAQRRLGEAAYFGRRHESTQDLESATVNRARRRSHRNRRQELDALGLVVLCLPACVTSLAFETIYNHREEILQNNFALHVAAMAIGIFGDRLKRLTMITSPVSNDLGNPEERAENSIITEHVLNRITQMGELILSDYHGDGNPRRREVSSDSQVQWHLLASNVNHLELWNMQCIYSELVQLISGFTSLQSVTLESIMLQRPPGARRQHAETDQLFWLAFLIELRRQMPELKLRLGELKSWSEGLRMVILPPSALEWLQIEAVPAGCTVGFDRETRLIEDFESFLPLWNAEDSDRGTRAREERKFGKLVDDAMESRWGALGYLR